MFVSVSFTIFFISANEIWSERNLKVFKFNIGGLECCNMVYGLLLWYSYQPLLNAIVFLYIIKSPILFCINIFGKQLHNSKIISNFEG